MKGKKDESKRRVRTGVSAGGEQGSREPGSDYGQDSELVSSGTGQVLEYGTEGRERRTDPDELGRRERLFVSEDSQPTVHAEGITGTSSDSGSKRTFNSSSTLKEHKDGGNGRLGIGKPSHAVEAGQDGGELDESSEADSEEGEQRWEDSDSPEGSFDGSEGEDSGYPERDETQQGETYSGVEAVSPYSVKENAPKNFASLAPFQFKKGVSGNPKGKPKGVYDKFSKTKLQKMLDIMGQDAHKIIRKAIKKALDDTDKDQAQMLKLLIDRLVPATKAVEVTGLGGRELALKVLVEGIETHNQVNQLDISDAKLIN